MSEYADKNVIPVEERFAGQKPACDGLYPHEVLLLSFAAGCGEGEEPSQSFWWDRYGVSDVKAVFQSLFQRGYIIFGGLSDAINAESVRELNDILKAHDLQAGGTKEVLVQRIVDNIPREELSRLFPRRIYRLTKKGRDILAKYEYIPYIHAHHMLIELDIYSMDELMRTPPYLPFREKILGFLHQRGQDYIEEGSFGLYRGVLRKMFDLTKETGDYDIAFGIICELLACVLSGLDNGSSPLAKQSDSDWLAQYRAKAWAEKADRFFPYESSNLRCDGYWINKIAEYKEKLGWDDDTFRQEILQGVSCELPCRVFSAQECADIILAEINKDAEKLAEVYSAAEKRFRETYPLPEGDN